MTAFNKTTDLPSTIDTLEKLAAWVGLTMTRLNPTLATLEDPGLIPERVCQATIRRIDDGSERIIIRISIPLNEAYKENGTAKFWTFATEISNVVLPAGFKT